MENNEMERIYSFDCTICTGPLKYPGPPISFFSFGKLLDPNSIALVDPSLLCREFLRDQCFRNGTYDGNKLLATRCGHVFHSGCLREWYFTRRYDRYPRCPLCNQRSSYEDCRVLHPTSFGNHDEDVCDDEFSSALIQKPLDFPDYSDISVASSLYSDEEDEMVDNQNADDHESESNDEDILLYEPELTDHQLEEFFASGDSTNPFHREIREPRSFLEIIRDGIAIVEKCNLVHILTLWFTILMGSLMHEVERFKYMQKIDEMDDDTLEENSPVSVGYPFLRQMICTTFGIMIYEGFLQVLSNKRII